MHEWVSLQFIYLLCVFSVIFRLLYWHGFIMFSWNFLQHHLAVAQEVPLHENHRSPKNLLWPVQANKLTNNIFHPFILSSIKRSDVLGQYRMLVSHCATGSFAVRMTEKTSILLLSLVSKCIHPIFIDLLKVNLTSCAPHTDVMKKSLCLPSENYITLSIFYLLAASV